MFTFEGETGVILAVSERIHAEYKSFYTEQPDVFFGKLKHCWDIELMVLQELRAAMAAGEALPKSLGRQFKANGGVQAGKGPLSFNMQDERGNRSVYAWPQPAIYAIIGDLRVALHLWHMLARRMFWNVCLPTWHLRTNIACNYVVDHMSNMAVSKKNTTLTTVQASWVALSVETSL